MGRRKRHSAEFKRQALKRANEPGVTDALVCEELGISTRQLRRWKDAVEEYGEEQAFPDHGKSRERINIDPDEYVIGAGNSVTLSSQVQAVTAGAKHYIRKLESRGGRLGAGALRRRLSLHRQWHALRDLFVLARGRLTG